MEKDKMTIHRALAELKLIDSRIEKAINVITPTGIHQKDKLVNETTEKEIFIKDAESKYQSVTDLIGRKRKIKSAIVKANSKTMIDVGGVSMTIADAINFKPMIATKKLLINRLESQYKAVLGSFMTNNEKVKEVALENARKMIGNDGDDKKATDADVKAIVDPFVKRNEFHMVDPLVVKELVEKLQEEVDNFEVEIDATLSEINATTIIEI